MVNRITLYVTVKMGLLLGGGHRHTPHGRICLMVTLFYDISDLGWGMRSTECHSGLSMKRPAFTGKDNKQHDSLAWLSTISFSVQCHTRFFLTMCNCVCLSSVRPWERRHCFWHLYSVAVRYCCMATRLVQWRLVNDWLIDSCSKPPTIRLVISTSVRAWLDVELSDWKVEKAKVKNHKPLWRHCSRTQNVCKSDLQTGCHFWHHKVHRAVSGSHAACQWFSHSLGQKSHSFSSLSLTAKIQCKKSP